MKILRLLLLLVIIPFIAGFSTPPPRMPYIHPVLKPYVIEWYRDMNSRGINLVHFSELDSVKLVPAWSVICGNPDAIGCYDSDVNTITVRVPYGDNLSDRDMYYRMTLYHELGHGVLKLPHNTFRFSIMSPGQSAPQWVYRDVWSKLVREYVDFHRILYNPTLLRR